MKSVAVDLLFLCVQSIFKFRHYCTIHKPIVKRYNPSGSWVGLIDVCIICKFPCTGVIVQQTTAGQSVSITEVIKHYGLFIFYGHNIMHTLHVYIYSSGHNKSHVPV